MPRNKLKPPNSPYKEMEFQQFLDILKKEQYKSWYLIAQALEVDRQTVTTWRRHPLAQEILSKNIEDAEKEMVSVGKRDWRMWREYMKMHNVADVDKQDLTSNGETLEAPIIYKPEKKMKRE